ncbi:GntR family transcriptional regulator [Salinibacterium sp. SYSU T00001]|uniref:GntR family transcriptional regulator n=1 Tax=Homoserinimonas sedimenticola TaxID=2986805 RepID=UPI0022358034|nr:GntR family transcriptional regulator [Salinibacterium sedimenticola]MCW4386042.1 GntR family transcriptional regulator [Salinibacterium sedimenticola]
MSAETVYEGLRRAIVTGEMHPNERLVETEIAERFAVGRSAVRTALVRLVQDGLVEHERNRGARVRLVGAHEATEIYEVRALLEGLTARKAAENLSDSAAEDLRARLAAIGALLEAGDLMTASERNVELHAVIVEIAGHDTAGRLLAGLNSHLVRYHYRTILHPGRAKLSYQEHAAIVEAIIARDPDAAESAMRAHMLALTATLAEPIPPPID